ncbi:MAG: protein-methionine-sulfoxide reductase catalytic subunit MsrP [Alphaproteobacteria bacterium]|nr:MAG: protein-methionine-sulfoxide reductase catalytic subunit MsrP [Alphaproteobacteria bacterium]
MLIKNRHAWQESENAVTPEGVYVNRRNFLRAGLAGGAAIAGLGSGLSSAFAAEDRVLAPLTYRLTNIDPGEEQTPFNAVTQYNNFYEYGTDKDDPAKNAWRLQPKPWSVTVDGMVDKPGTYGLEDVIDFKGLQERIYRLRCVEAWSMVIPWIGVPLGPVLQKFGIQSGAKYVRFETLADKKQMPGIKWPVLDWPYEEGLRLDEAMNELAFLAVGLYGNELPNQNGAPIRLVVPWKYGFKSIKSIVRISLTDKEPSTSWSKANAREYGFYSNVNPDVDHPRWSQKRERRIGEFARRETLMFNGYGDLVADLYKGMDLKANY